MSLPDNIRSRVRERLKNLDFSPWHDCWSVNVWHNHENEYTIALGNEVLDRTFTLEPAVDFVMQNGWPR
jgi:hypothetical protein